MIQDYFILVYFALWLHHSLSQSDARLKPIKNRLLVFSCALGSLVVFPLSSHWHLKVFSFLQILVAIALGLVSIKKFSN